MSKLCQFLIICHCYFSTSFAFYTWKLSSENVLPEQGVISNRNFLAKRSASTDAKTAIPNKNGLHGNQLSNHLDNSHGNQTSLATNETEGHDTEEEHGGSEGHGEGETRHGIHLAVLDFHHVQSPFIIAVFLLTAGIVKLGFHHANFLSSRVPESCLLIILGAVVGAILHFATDDESFKPNFTSELFFLYLLPPIVLESAYSLHDRTFYENIGTTLIYAVIGTVLNCFLIGPVLFGLYEAGALGEGMPDISLIKCLVFSAVIVAVDPVAVLAIFQEVGVNNTLYFLVFGESLLNDAVTVVLYNTMKTFNLMETITADQIVLGIVQFFVVSLGGLSIGILCGAFTAIMTKYTEHCRVVEPLAVFAMAYISYLIAEIFHFSGIISIIGCGLVQAQYAFHNISRKSYTTVKYFSKMQSSTSDCIIFLFLGISLFKEEVLDGRNWHVGFILWSLFLCLFVRFMVVFGLTCIINKSSRVRRIDLEEQFIMAYGGLRGAVAYSLVDVLDQRNLPKGHFLTTTLVVIFFTVFVQGITIKPLVKLLRVKMQADEKLLMSEEINSHVTDHVMAGIEEILGEKGEHHWRELIEYYNSRFFKYWLQRDPISADEQIMKIFEQLALEQHFENLMGTKMVQEKYGSDQELNENLNASFEAENEDEGSDDNAPGDETLLQVPSLVVSTEDINADLDVELIREQATRRRKSLFPINLSKKAETKLIENPTAVDIRKIMVPARRQLQFRKLDKNLTSDDSENDLLRYLQDKQQRTRRMSQAIFAPPQLPTLGEGVEYNPNARRKSVNPIAMAGNYKRRLSLAVPQSSYGRRGVSMGNVLKGMDSPARRRLRLKRWNTSESSDASIKDTAPASPAASTQRNPRRVAFTGSPSTPSMGSDVLGIIAEDGDETGNGVNGSNKLGDNATDTKPRARLKKRELSGGSLKLRKTAFSDVIDEVTPGSPHGSHVSSTSSINSYPPPTEKSENDTNNSKLKRSSSTGSSRTRSSDRGIRFVPGRNSPSISRKRLQRSSTTSDPTENRWSTTSDPREKYSEDIEMKDDKAERVGSMRKNVSYTKALSNEGVE